VHLLFVGITRLFYCCKF